MTTDFNVQIIEGVRQCPILYDNNYTLEERSQAWLMLADKLTTNEQILKVRWHFLLQRYQHEPNFRYASKMSFLDDYISTLPVKDHQWPEFLITEEDLKDDGLEEKTEFHYLIEEDIEKNGSKDALTQNNSNIVEKEITIAADESQNDHITNAESCTQKCTPLKFHTKIQSQRNKDNNEVYAESPTNITNEIDDMNPEKNVVNQAPDKESSNIESNTPQQNRIVETDVKVPKENSDTLKEKSKSPCNDRCEDDIFGELVAASLKRMDESKKKSIKREIMNLLFS